MYVCMHECMYVYTYVYIYIYIYMCYVCMCVCVCVYTYIYIYIYILGVRAGGPDCGRIVAADRTGSVENTC